MGFSAGKLCSGEQGGEGSGERGDRIQLGLCREAAAEPPVISPHTAMGNVTPHLFSLSVSLRTQGTLWSSTVQGRCSLSGREKILPVLYFTEEQAWDFPFFHSSKKNLVSSFLAANIALTMMDNAVIQQFLHQFNCSLSVGGLFMVNQPVDELFGNEAVGVCLEVVPPIFDDLFFVQSEPGGQINL